MTETGEIRISTETSEEEEIKAAARAAGFDNVYLQSEEARPCVLRAIELYQEALASKVSLNALLSAAFNILGQATLVEGSRTVAGSEAVAKFLASTQRVVDRQWEHQQEDDA